MHLLISTFLADIAATFIVWIFGILFGNSSMYDPYWSVAPLIIVLCWIIIKVAQLTAIDILFLVAITVWGIRLTLNWAIRWKGLHSQDWRYTMLKKKSPRLWFLTNLIGINLMPTVIVFGALTSAYFGIGQERQLNFFTGIWFIVCLGAVLVQTISDRYMDLFKKNRSNKNEYIDKGIWLMQTGTTPRIWVTVTGPILITLLFIFVSIPMMEKHLQTSIPVYSHYQKQISMLMPMPRKKER